MSKKADAFLSLPRNWPEMCSQWEASSLLTSTQWSHWKKCTLPPLLHVSQRGFSSLPGWLFSCSTSLLFSPVPHRTCFLIPRVSPTACSGHQEFRTFTQDHLGGRCFLFSTLYSQKTDSPCAWLYCWQTCALINVIGSSHFLSAELAPPGRCLCWPSQVHLRFPVVSEVKGTPRH